MNAPKVFDCDDVKGLIFSYCLPQFPIVTKNMIDDRRDKLYWDANLPRPNVIKPPKKILIPARLATSAPRIKKLIFSPPNKCPIDLFGPVSN